MGLVYKSMTYSKTGIYMNGGEFGFDKLNIKLGLGTGFEAGTSTNLGVIMIRNNLLNAIWAKLDGMSDEDLNDLAEALYYVELETNDDIRTIH